MVVEFMERSPFCGREILRIHLRPGQSSTCEGAEMEGALLEDLMERVTKIRKVKVKKKKDPPQKGNHQIRRPTTLFLHSNQKH